jgi:L,D-peptidoglycan transpeptidase YkuD (ErfK/YbiS/YcfS/YnhG family)
MRRAAIVVATVLALTAVGALVSPASAAIPATNRHEGDGTTPAGTFGFVYGFGSQPNPGMRGFSYRRLQPNSCWSGSRADYNRWVTRPRTRGGSLWKNRRVAYRYAAVIDFNYRRPV